VASQKKQEAQKFGAVAETLAACLLMLKGYRIIARRFRVKVGEIDIIAKRGPVLAFIEVKARRDIDAAANSIQPRQAERIARASQAFLQTRPDLNHLDRRFDAILVSPGRWPVHVVDTWRPGL